MVRCSKRFFVFLICLLLLAGMVGAFSVYAEEGQNESASQITTAATYKITYKLNGGKNYSKNPSTYNGTKDITLGRPTRSGYSFLGWYSDSSYKTRVSKIAKGSKGNKTLYARWAADSKSLFVSTAGKDSNTGTYLKPLKTVQKAVDKAKAGTTIYVMSGTFAGKVTFKKSGASENHIVLTAYPGSTPKLTLASKESEAIIDLNGQDYIEISGLDIGNAKRAKVYGILVTQGCRHITIKNNNIHNIATTYPNDPNKGEANGILMYGDGSSSSTAISYVLVDGNQVHDNTNGWSENISASSNCYRITIRNNKVYNNTNIGIDLYGNAGYCSVEKYDQPRNCTVSGNTVYNCKSSYAECAGIYVDGARDCVIEKNKSYKNAYGIEIGSEEGENHPNYPVQSITVQNNTVYSNTHCGIRIGGYDKDESGWVKNCTISGNTLKNNGSGSTGWDGELNLEMCDGIKISGNKFYKSSNKFPMIASDFNDSSYKYSSYVKNITFEKNTYYSPSTSGIYFDLYNSTITGISNWKKKASSDTAAAWQG